MYEKAYVTVINLDYALSHYREHIICMFEFLGLITTRPYAIIKSMNEVMPLCSNKLPST